MPHLYGHHADGTPKRDPSNVAINAAVIALEWPENLAGRRCGPDEWDRIALCAMELARVENRDRSLWDQHPQTFEEVAARIAHAIAVDSTADLSPFQIVAFALDRAGFDHVLSTPPSGGGR